MTCRLWKRATNEARAFYHLARVRPRAGVPGARGAAVPVRLRRPPVSASSVPGLTDSDAYWELFELVGPAGVESLAVRLERARLFEREAAILRRRLAAEYRASGATWAEVGAALGVTLQGAALLAKRPAE